MQSLSSPSTTSWTQGCVRKGAKAPPAPLALQLPTPSTRGLRTSGRRAEATRLEAQPSSHGRSSGLCCSACLLPSSPSGHPSHSQEQQPQQQQQQQPRNHYGQSRREEDAPRLPARRTVVTLPAALLGAFLASTAARDAAEAVEGGAASSGSGVATPYTDMPALRGKDYGKTQMRYADYTLTESGLQFKDLREGNGATPRDGQTVVVDWAGFTIGYYGRIFEARNKAKGGSFEGNEKEFFRFQVGRGQVIAAFEEAVASMQVGGVRRIIVPPELGYPNNDFNQKGPRPITFSGQRALDFVLKNQGLIDKTLLFDIELLRIVEG